MASDIDSQPKRRKPIQRKPNQNGKGSALRHDLDLNKLRENYDNIPNFGFKPKWALELEKENK